MQTPSASDPSFKVFLDKLKEQNDRGFLTQLLQLKSEREIAGEDNDKREEQLDEVISSLKEVRVAVTGVSLDIDITPLVNIGENQTRLLEELSKESALSRKLTEGSVEYDKEAAQYRNTSGRDIESKVSGKMSRDGGFLDFETARDTLSGQGERVRKENKLSLIPGVLRANLRSFSPVNAAKRERAFSPVNAAKRERGSVTGDVDPKKEEVDNFDPSLLGRLKSFMTDGESDKPGYGLFQKPPIEVEKKEREAKVSSLRQENPEADNITSTGEIQADAAKSDLELSKQMLDSTKEQITVLKEIRDALAPRTPAELSSQKSTPYSPNEGVLSSVDSLGIPDFNFPRRTPTGPSTPTNKKPRGKVPTTKPGGRIPTGTSKLGLGLKIGGGLLAGAGLALGAYEASEFLDETGYGDKMKAGAGQSAEKAFRENVAPTIDPVKAGVTKEQAVAALENGSPRDIEKLGGKDALMKIAGLTPTTGVSTEQAAAARSNYASVDPRRVDTAGKTVASTSTENVDMGREHLRGGGGTGNTVISNNVNNSSTTKYVPMKASPRPEYTGSALDRYQDRITAY